MLGIGLGLTSVRQLNTSFSPINISGCVLWLRADLGVTLNTTTVSAWADQSGNGNNFSQGTANKQPTFTASDAAINSQPVLDFDGSNDVLDGSFAAGLTGAKNWSLICVFKADTFAAARVAVSVGTITTGYGIGNNISGTSKREISHYGVANIQDSASTSSYEVWTVTRDNAGSPSLTMKVNGATQTLDVPTATMNTPGVTAAIGAKYTVSFFDGKIAEVILYNVDISSSLSNLHSYLSTRYGISIS